MPRCVLLVGILVAGLLGCTADPARNATTATPSSQLPDGAPAANIAFVGRTVYEYSPSYQVRIATYYAPNGQAFMVTNRNQAHIFNYTANKDGYCLEQKCYFYTGAKPGEEPGVYFRDDAGRVNRVVAIKPGDPDGITISAVRITNKQFVSSVAPLIPWFAAGAAVALEDTGSLFANPVDIPRCSDGSPKITGERC